MRTVLMSAVFIISCCCSRAQTVQYSIPFDEPKNFGNKVFQCSNGNTMFFSFTKRDGIAMTLYDTARRVKVKTNFEGKEWVAREMSLSEVKAIYEMRGNVVIFLQQLLSNKPMLFRIVIDPNTGRLVQEQKIGEMDKYNFGDGYALTFGGIDPKTFHVLKDEWSDYYAVVRFDGFASADENRIEVTHYNGAHEEINRLEYKLPDGEAYKYIRYLGMCVDSNRSVFLATYAFDTKSSGGNHSKIFFAKLKAGEKSFEQRPLDITEDFKETTSVLQYNPGKKTLDLLLLTLIESKGKSINFSLSKNATTNYYGLLHMSLDANAMTMLFARPLTMEKLSDYKKQKLKIYTAYTGLPQNMILNHDFTTTIAFEEISSKSYSGSHSTTVTYTLGDIGVLDLNNQGEEENGYVFQKIHKTGAAAGNFAQYDRSHSYISLPSHGAFVSSGDFYSYDLVNTDSARYVIYNDNPDNFRKAPNEHVSTVGSITGTHTVCQKLVNGSAEKFLLFDDSNQEQKMHFTAISSSHYQRKQKSYAAMVIEQIGKEKKARIAWVKFS